MSPRTARIALAVLLLTIYSTLAVIRRVTNALRDAGMLKLTVGVIFALTAVAVVRSSCATRRCVGRERSTCATWRSTRRRG